MAKRETFSAHIICPKCKRQGQVLWSENENPIFSGLERELEEVPEGFEVGQGKDATGDPVILCSRCQVKVSG